MRRILILAALLIPGFLLSQTKSDSDKLKQGCEGKLFTKTEVLPGYKQSKIALQDSLAVYLNSNNSAISNEAYSFIFVLNLHSEIGEISSLRPVKDSEMMQHLIRALKKYSYLLIPAIQNGRHVCSYVKLHVIFKKGRPDLRITQDSSSL